MVVEEGSLMRGDIAWQLLWFKVDLSFLHVRQITILGFQMPNFGVGRTMITSWKGNFTYSADIVKSAYIQRFFIKKIFLPDSFPNYSFLIINPRWSQGSPPATFSNQGQFNPSFQNWVDVGRASLINEHHENNNIFPPVPVPDLIES